MWFFDHVYLGHHCQWRSEREIDEYRRREDRSNALIDVQQFHENLCSNRDNIR